MHARPDATVILAGLARFLDDAVTPALAAEERSVAFRLRIATALCHQLAFELMGADTQETAELERLHTLLGLPAPGPLGRPLRRAALEQGNRALCERLKAPDPSREELAAIHEHLRQTLAEQIAILNPRFAL